MAWFRKRERGVGTSASQLSPRCVASFLPLSLFRPFAECLSSEIMLFSTLALAAAFAGFANTSPVVLEKRQGGGSDLPTYREIPDGSGGYQKTNDSTNGSSYLDPVVTSVPDGVDPSSWKGYTSENEPYANAAKILGTFHQDYVSSLRSIRKADVLVAQTGNPATNGTNTTLAWKGQPAGGLLENNPVYTPGSNFDFQSLNLALNQELIELFASFPLLAKTERRVSKRADFRLFPPIVISSTTCSPTSPPKNGPPSASQRTTGP